MDKQMDSTATWNVKGRGVILWDWQACLCLILSIAVSTQLPCIIGSCLNSSENWAGGVHLGDLVTGTNRHYQGQGRLQSREKSQKFKNTFLIQILVWLKTNNRVQNWRKTELWCRKLFSLKQGLLINVSNPCPYTVLKGEQKIKIEFKKKKSNETEGQKFKERRENQS